MPPEISALAREHLDRVRAFYVDLMKKVQAAPEWKEYIERTSQTDTFLTGAEFQKFIDEDIERVRKVAAEEGWLVSQ